MKVRNLKLKNLELTFRDKLIKFDEEGISEDLKEEEAKSLVSLSNFELIKEQKKKNNDKETKEDKLSEVIDTVEAKPEKETAKKGK